MRKTINVSLPPRMANDIRAQAEAAGFATVSEYIREVLRQDMRQRLLTRLREEEFQRHLAAERFRVRQGYNPYLDRNSKVRKALKG